MGTDLSQASGLHAWLAWLETLHPKKIDFSLNRIHAVLEALGLENPPFRCITIGGTNGKGSCVAYLASVYQQAGYVTGAFTSPHLVEFNERIVIDGQPAEDTEIVAALWALEEARGHVTLSYFEASAVAAFICFARRGVEVALLEVGMGGRLDAVNVYSADAAIIASISLDHVEWLGNDREQIGYEKAGIMRAGRPVAIAERDPPASLRAAASRTGALAAFIGTDFSVQQAAGGKLEVALAGGMKYLVPSPGFGGAEQHDNLAACIATVDSLQGMLPVSTAALAAGISAARPRGRMQAHSIDGVEWLFDVAHNPAAARCFAAYAQARPVAGRTLAVFGAMRDKDLRGVLEHFSTGVTAWHVFTVDGERAAPATDIEALILAQSSAVVTVWPEAAAASAGARRQAGAGDRVLVFGSFHAVGPVLSALGLYSRKPVGSA